MGGGETMQMWRGGGGKKTAAPAAFALLVQHLNHLSTQRPTLYEDRICRYDNKTKQQQTKTKDSNNKNKIGSREHLFYLNDYIYF